MAQDSEGLGSGCLAFDLSTYSPQETRFVRAVRFCSFPRSIRIIGLGKISFQNLEGVGVRGKILITKELTGHSRDGEKSDALESGSCRILLLQNLDFKELRFKCRLGGARVRSKVARVAIYGLPMKILEPDAAMSRDFTKIAEYAGFS